MKLKFQRSYRKPGTGQLVFVYTVTGSDAQLAQYKEIQGENYRATEDGEPLYFSTRSIPDGTALAVTQNNRVVPDMSKFDQAASLAAQYGGNLGQELAKVAAANLMNFSTPAPAQTPAKAGATAGPGLEDYGLKKISSEMGRFCFVNFICALSTLCNCKNGGEGEADAVQVRLLPPPPGL